MAKDPIVQTGSTVLRQKAGPIVKKDIGSRKLAAILKKMSAALKPEAHGVALAAPQVGVPLRIFIVAGRVFAEPDAAEPPKDKVFINPEFVRISKKKSLMSEGCLSVRGVYGTVKRAEKATVKALDEKGKLFTYHGSGLVAQIFQHEMDHLDGVLFIDKAEALDESERKNEKPK
jgi:peptide deformylase